MAIAELDRAGLRRATLRAALRRGDTMAAARAWDRVRVDGAGLRHDEIRAARDARAAVGRAIRDARWRRSQAVNAAARALAPAIPVPGVRRALRLQRAIGTAVAVLIVFALMLVIAPPKPAEGLAPAAAAPELTTPARTEPTRAPAGARGRSSELLAIVPASAPPEPVTTPVPTAEPSAAPPSAAPLSTPATSPSVGGVPSGAPGGVSGGVPGGTPGGVVGGAPGGTGSATPAPSPAPSVNVLPLTPPPLAADSDRFLFRVIDSRTGSTLSNVCVDYATLKCTADRPHTNALGYFWLDLSPPAAAAWTFRFTLEGYRVTTVNRTYTSGQGTVTVTVSLRRG